MPRARRRTVHSLGTIGGFGKGMVSRFGAMKSVAAQRYLTCWERSVGMVGVPATGICVARLGGAKSVNTPRTNVRAPSLDWMRGGNFKVAGVRRFGGWKS